MTSRMLVIVTVAVLLAGSAVAQTGKTQAKEQGAPAAGSKQSAWTGAVSEAEFKKMHQLRTGEVPPLHGQMIEVAGAKAYLSLPDKAQAPVPGVVVIQEWWGLNDNIKHWSDRLAAEGYAALAPDLYGGKVATTPDSAMAYMKGVEDARAMEILRAAHRFLIEDSRVRAPRTGSIGWCFGGGWSLQLALNAPDQNAAVMYYGRPVLDPEQLKSLKAPLLGVFGNKDRSITPDLVNQFDAALKKAGVKYQILRYDAEHAFANPSNPIYDEKSAGDAWTHVVKFLHENLRAKAGSGR